MPPVGLLVLFFFMFPYHLFAAVNLLFTKLPKSQITLMCTSGVICLVFIKKHTYIYRKRDPALQSSMSGVQAAKQMYNVGFVENCCFILTVTGC